MTLTDVKLRTLNTPGKHFDGGGLYLEITASGGRYWRLKYRIGGREKRLACGVYPDVSLKLARQRRDEARRMLAEGLDPGEEKKAARAEAVRQHEQRTRAAAGLPAADSFEAVALEWLDRVQQHKVSPGHLARTTVRLKQHVFPWLGARPVGTITAPQLLECLQRVEKAGKVETAHKVKQACGLVFRYGVATGRCERDPSGDLREALRPIIVTHRAAVLKPQRVGELLRALDGYQGQPTTRAALRLAALLFQRPTEIRGALWSEIDLDGAVFTIQSARMKRSVREKASGPPHLVPLSRQAVEILRELQPLTGRGALVFPGLRSAKRPISDMTMNAALRRLGFGPDEMTAHGFRAMARTLLHERLGVAPEVIEAQLAHAVPDTLGRAYNRTEFLDQRRAMMQTWADYLDQLKRGAQVLPLRTA
jgi:integrase